MKITVSILSLMLITGFSYSQKWTDMMEQPGANFYEIQTEFYDYFQGKDITNAGSGFKQFKRWENFVEPRVYPSGDLSLLSLNYENFKAFLSKNTVGNKSSSTMASTTWTAMGPMGPMSGVATNGFPRKAGRDNFITFHPNIATTFWAGAPAGGLWKTTDGGSTWTTNTDYLTVIGCSDLAIDPSNPNTMYLATGDGDAGDTESIGVLKSTDGGLTWNNTGLSFTVNQQRRMRRLIINPSNPQILLAATNVGIYRTTNGGTSWSIVASGNWYDLSFKPGDPNTVYAGGTVFSLSTNGGASFTTISSGIPTSGANRLRIAVTAADPAYVYVLRSSSSGSSYAGVYRSVNSGVAFTVMSTSPNILGNDCGGTSTTGQGWYDLALAVSPTNKNRVDVGGVNVWSSNSGGATGTWTCNGCWIGTTFPAVYMKADIHDLEYDSNGALFAASDGGIFKYNTTSWIDLNNQRNIAQIYKLGCSSLNPNKWISGHQDNGTGLYNGTTYQASYPGDGMDCFIDRTNDQNLFASTPQGNFVRSTNGGTSYSSANTGLSGTGAWVSPWKQDPVTANVLYAGRSQMFRSTNTGASWIQLTATGGSGSIVEFAIAPSNNQVLYVIHGTSIRKTTNGGASWTNVTGTIPVSSGAPTFITIDPNDPNTAWVTLSGYSSGNKIFQTSNGGSTWTNISANLPNLPANCSIYQPSSNGRLYIGMDVGVYTKDNSSGTWILYNTGLPNVPISDFEISPAAPTILRAATYGRGVYQVDLIPSAVTPVSVFNYSGSTCQGSTLNFADNSSQSPTAWAWQSFPSTGVNISSPSSQNPSITFQNAGTYTISLTASNGFGPGTSDSQVITIYPSPALSLSSSAASETVCVDELITLSANGVNSYTWYPTLNTGSSINFIATFSNSITYTVRGESDQGCVSEKMIALVVSECTGIKNSKVEKGDFEIYPNPANTLISIKSISNLNAELNMEVLDASGKLVFKQNLHFKEGEKEINLDISSLPNGVYILRIISSKEKTQLIKLVKE